MLFNLHIFFRVDLRKLSSVLFWDRNTVSNTASATCSFHSGDWQLEKKKTKILQNEKAYDDWIWKKLERWNTLSLAHMTGHIKTSVKPSLPLTPQLSKLSWLLLLKLSVGLVIVATTNHLHHVGTLLVFMRWPFPRTKNSCVYVKICWQKPVRTRVSIGFITPTLWVIEILLQINSHSWNYLCISANASIV